MTVRSCTCALCGMSFEVFCKQQSGTLALNYWKGDVKMAFVVNTSSTKSPMAKNFRRKPLLDDQQSVLFHVSYSFHKYSSWTTLMHSLLAAFL